MAGAFSGFDAGVIRHLHLFGIDRVDTSVFGSVSDQHFVQISDVGVGNGLHLFPVQEEPKEMGGVVFIEDLMGGEVIEKKLKGEVFDFEVFSGQIKRAMLSYHPEDLQEAEEKIWPYIFGPQVKILPTAFVNEEGFVEVVDYGSSSRG